MEKYLLLWVSHAEIFHGVVLSLILFDESSPSIELVEFR